MADLEKPRKWLLSGCALISELTDFVTTGGWGGYEKLSVYF